MFVKLAVKTSVILEVLGFDQTKEVWYWFESEEVVGIEVAEVAEVVAVDVVSRFCAEIGFKDTEFSSILVAAILVWEIVKLLLTTVIVDSMIKRVNFDVIIFIS
jgi:hypothetical protein